jgi:hypothetical protein
VEAGLALCRSEQDALRTSLTTKRSIDKVRRYATKLRDELGKLLTDSVFLSAGQPHWHSRPRPQTDDFEPLFAALKSLHTVMETAQSRTAMRPGRKSVEPLDSLVQYLNWIQADIVGDNVIRSNKNTEKARSSDFIRICCKKVGFTDGQIERALRRNASKFHHSLEHDAFDLSLGVSVREEKLRTKIKRARPRLRSPL